MFCRVDESTRKFVSGLSCVLELQVIPDEQEILEHLREIEFLLKNERLFSSLYNEKDVVKLIDGPWSGLKGVVEKTLLENDRVLVRLESVSYQARMTVEGSMLKVLQHADTLKIVRTADEIAFEKIRLAFETYQCRTRALPGYTS